MSCATVSIELIRKESDLFILQIRDYNNPLLQKLLVITNFIR